MENSKRAVICSKCGSELKPLGNTVNKFQREGWCQVDSKLEEWNQWLGTTCSRCLRIFCEKCHESGLGAGNCPDCGGELRPASSHFLPKDGPDNNRPSQQTNGESNIADNDCFEKVIEHFESLGFEINDKVVNDDLSRCVCRKNGMPTNIKFTPDLGFMVYISFGLNKQTLNENKSQFLELLNKANSVSLIGKFYLENETLFCVGRFPPYYSKQEFDTFLTWWSMDLVELISKNEDIKKYESK